MESHRKQNKAITSYCIGKNLFCPIQKKQSWQGNILKIDQFINQHRQEFITLHSYFNQPLQLINKQNLQYYGSTQRLRQGVFILMRGKVRVLVHDERIATTRAEIIYATKKMTTMINKEKDSTSKFISEEADQAFQVIQCINNNVICFPETLLWYVEQEDLIKQEYIARQKTIGELITRNAQCFYTHSKLPFTLIIINRSFRSSVNLNQDAQLGVIKFGSLLVKWKSNCKKQIILCPGSILVNNSNFYYQCLSATVEVIEIRRNQSFQLFKYPQWTIDTKLQKDSQKQRHINIQHFPKNRIFSKSAIDFRSKSLSKYPSSFHRDQLIRNRMVSKIDKIKDQKQKTKMIIQSQKSRTKTDWSLLRNLDSYQVASTTWSQQQFKLLSKLKNKYNKQSGQCHLLKNQIMMRRKKLTVRPVFKTKSVLSNDQYEEQQILKKKQGKQNK